MRAGEGQNAGWGWGEGWNERWCEHWCEGSGARAAECSESRGADVVSREMETFAPNMH